MSSPLIPVLTALAVVLVLAAVLLARRRRALGRRRAAARLRQKTAHGQVRDHDRGSDADHQRLSDTGIEVDELHVADDELLSTSERHIGDTQPVDRRLLRK